MDEIAEWRRQIDEIDERLVKLLNERAACAVEIGKIKRKKDLEIYNPAREESIIQHISQLNKGPLDNPAIQKLFGQVIEECRKCETC